MAGSRLPKIGDIFTRATSLLRGGAIKPADKPVWYDVYEAFPPLQAPTYERSRPNSLEVKQIFYPEDLIRAKFYRKHGSPGMISLDESSRYKRRTICESFVAAYQEIESRQERLSPDELMQAAEVELERQGIYIDWTKRPRTVESLNEPLEELLETKSAITAAALPEHVMTKFNLNDIFMMSKGSESAEASEAGIAVSATSSVAAGSGAVPGTNMAEAATSSSDVATTATSSVAAASGAVPGTNKAEAATSSSDVATPATSSVAAASGAVPGTNKAEAATSSSDVHVKEQNKDGSGGSGA